MNKTVKIFLAVFCAFFISSCLEEGEKTLLLEGKLGNIVTVDGFTIPSDSQADPNPSIETTTTQIPNFQHTVEKEGGHAILRIDMTGIQDPQTKEWVRLVGTGGSGGYKQNVWLSIDGKSKGICAYNNADDDDKEVTFMSDVVFLVDNSGSMSDESNAIARDITTWASELSNSSLDVRFGCVGYGGNVGSQYGYLVSNYGITGALNMTSYSALDAFLNDRSVSGTGRTKGYAGSDATSLQNTALLSYSKAGGECGVQALRFADEHFTFRTGALRTYINFTDDANYPGSDSEISVNYLLSNWKTTQGTIHTVLSRDSTWINNRLSIGEKPWLMSEYTGGTFMTAPSDFSGVTLNSLPITGAMQNSYEILAIADAYMDDQPHVITLTIYSEDGKVRAEKIVSTTFYYSK